MLINKDTPQFIVLCDEQPGHGESISFDEKHQRWCFNKTNGGYFIDAPYAINDRIPVREEWDASTMPDWAVHNWRVVAKVEVKRIQEINTESPQDFGFTTKDGFLEAWELNQWYWLVTVEPVDAEA